MFCKSVQDSAAAPSFPCLMMVVACFRQASGTRRRHLRHALRDSGREYLTNAHRVIPGARMSGQMDSILSHLTLKS